MKINLFYSWQNDLEKKYNRNFIEDCLKRAIKRIHNNLEQKNDSSHNRINHELIIDQATRNTLGAKEISTTIFSKIDDAGIFVADVSLIGKISTKHYPNSNVLTELGYSASKIGWENIILIFNLSKGKPENLPFDIRGRRLLTYNYDIKTNLSDKKNEKENLTNTLSTILSEQIKHLNSIEKDPITKLYVYLWNKIAFLYSDWEKLIESMYKFVSMEKKKDITNEQLREEFKIVCSKINPKNKPIFNINYFGNYNSWDDLFQSMCDDVTKKTNQIFLFHNKLNLNIIDKLSKAENITSGKFFFLGISQQSSLQIVSEDIIETYLNLKEAAKTFRINYKEQEKEYHRQYINERNDDNFGKW